MARINCDCVIKAHQNRNHKMYLALFFAVSSFTSLVWTQTVPLQPSESYTRQLIVDEFDRSLYQMFWKRVGTDEIQFEIHCKTLGWVGFGISPRGSMSGSDIAKFWIKDNITFLFDTYALGSFAPRIDTIKNLVWLGGSEVNGYTMVKFKRKLVTGDTAQDLDILNTNQFVIFAWGQEDPVTGEGDWLYHGGNRYSMQLNLLTNA